VPVERHAVSTVPVKTGQTRQIAKSATRHVRYKAPDNCAGHDRRSKHSASAAAEEARNEGTGYELFLSQLGKAKETK
jgi:hypothetical protein